MRSPRPKAFVLNEESFPAEITEDGETIEITIQNQIIRGTVETTKADATTRKTS